MGLREGSKEALPYEQEEKKLLSDCEAVPWKVARSPSSPVLLLRLLLLPGVLLLLLLSVLLLLLLLPPHHSC